MIAKPTIRAALLAFAIAASPAVAAPSKTELVDAVEEALRGLRLASGKFDQIDFRNARSAGVFYMKRPGRVRFEYTRNNPILIVSDGTTLVVQNRDLKTFDRVPLALTPLSLFLGPDVDLSRPGLVSDIRSVDGYHALTLVDPDRKIQGRLVLIFSESDYRLLGWSVFDAGGRGTQVRLTEVNTPRRLSASLFRIEDPEDEDNRDR